VSSRSEKKRRARPRSSDAGMAFVVVDDVVRWPPRITGEQLRNMERLMNDDSLILECSVIMPLDGLPGEILTASDSGRTQ
jgi:hypothetical protein